MNAHCRNAGWSLRAAIVAALMAGLSLVSAPARADVSGAAESFRAGTDDFAGAARAFEEANRLAPHGAALYNAGRAWEAAGEPARAADAYDAALRSGSLGGQQETGARARLAALRSTIGRLEIAGPAGSKVSVAHIQRAPGPLAVHVAPGDHTVRVELLDGRTLTRSLSVAAGSTAVLAVEAAEASARATPGAPPAAGQPKAPAPPRSIRPVLGWVALGGAVASSGAAIALGVLTLDAKKTFENAGGRDADQHDRAVALRTGTNVAWIGAATLAVTGIVLLVTAPRRDTQPLQKANRLAPPVITF
jgi:tetratricopeptide (TPR) repeat protein